MQKVAAYCRVSTEKEDQVNSLDSQKRYFTEYINRNPLWELAKVYVDEGITGTSTKKRHAFNKMMADAMEHQFDLIITKEISRFARNTLDSIYYTRRLKEQGIGVIYLNDNINTLDADAELRLTIMSSIAQEESRKTSERVKWGQKRRMEQGVVFGRDMLGYDVREGILTINEEGAKVVQLIFNKYVFEGKGTHVIARELKESGILTTSNKNDWHNNVILRILRNEKYCGDLVQKKTYTPSYLNHEKKQNLGQEEIIEITNHHEPIISKELFIKAQQELKRRSPSTSQKEKYSNRYCFSGKIKCGLCGSSFVSRSKKRKDGSIYRIWRCYEAVIHGSRHIDTFGDGIMMGCNCPSFSENDIKEVLQHIVKNLIVDKNAMINKLTSIIKQKINVDISNKSTKGIQEKLKEKINKTLIKKQKLIGLYLDKEISKDEFSNLNLKYERELTTYQQEINNLEDQEEQQKGYQDEYKKVYHKGNKKVQQDNTIRMEKDINSIIKYLVYGDEWNDTFYQHIIDKIVMYDNYRIEVTFKMLPIKWCYQMIEQGVI